MPVAQAALNVVKQWLTLGHQTGGHVPRTDVHSLEERGVAERREEINRLKHPIRMCAGYASDVEVPRGLPKDSIDVAPGEGHRLLVSQHAVLVGSVSESRAKCEIWQHCGTGGGSRVCAIAA